LVADGGAECPAATRAPPFIATPTPWITLLTSLAIHSSVFHLAGNAWFLYLFGRVVEDATGHLRTTALIIVGGILGALAHVIASPESVRPLVGASGSIAALMGAALIWFPHTPVVMVLPVGLREVGLRWFVGVWFVVQVLSIWLADVSLLAHLVGALAGVALALALRWAGLVEERSFAPRVSN